eukprot:GFUD01023389.1.p1 GENE.GFUD01023389.1~~GFUD01023389.1.p1  ORF type:complete len:299 (+),score=62.38 GFUD01023389.1:109-1005(+)
MSGQDTGAESGHLQMDPFMDLEECLSEEWIERARELLGEIQTQRPTYLEGLRKAVGKDDYLEQFKNVLDDRKLTKFLRAGNWDVIVALELLRSFWMFGKDFPECVKSSLPSKLENVWDKKFISCNPVRDNLGRRIVTIHRMGSWDPAAISPEQFLALAHTVLEMISREPKTQIAGMILLLNADGFSFKHLRYFGINQMQCLAAILNGAVPLWFRRFHIVNQPRVFDVFFGLIKPFLNERIRDNLVFHSDLKSLHKDLRQELVPPELGGTSQVQLNAQEATKELEDEFFQRIEICQKQK